MDASRLGRSLELTFQLLELNRPMVVALNMMDEARRRGSEIDHDELSTQLGVPVVTTTSRLGMGLKQLFRESLRHAVFAVSASSPTYDNEVEDAIGRVVSLIDGRDPVPGIPARLVATKLLEADPHLSMRRTCTAPDLEASVAEIGSQLESAHGWSADQVVSGSRHALAHAMEKRVVAHQIPMIGWRERADGLLLNQWTGGPLMVLILAGFFWAVFGVGKRVEAPLLVAFNWLQGSVADQFTPGSLAATVADGLVMGLGGGVAIVLPYLIPVPHRSRDPRGHRLSSSARLYPRQFHAPDRACMASRCCR